MILNHGVRGSVPTYNVDTSYYGGSTPCVETVSYTHLTLPTTPYV